MRIAQFSTRIGVTAALAAGLWVGAAPPSAQACTCETGPTEVEQRVASQHGSDNAVFVGVPADASIEGASVTYTFDVREIYDGSLDDSVLVTTASETTACGSVFSVGDEYIVFASRSGSSSRELSVNKCSATTSASDRATRDAAESVYGAPIVLVEEPTPISATLWLGVAGGVSVLIAVLGTLLLGRRPR
ncbi:hypothetical protein [Rhodococcus sp. P1Y]|uniref:hypothetical protein n=1 Tax=Rhodococcus sp. P1Y TaxID=1302308 RepID=UPI000EACC585|nr:hypothetical protein [Rhodococcus sp. P1Y]AYJ47660.1 hypothetical protein D8W71_04155 [Rhodococcus sp. P1Y]